MEQGRVSCLRVEPQRPAPYAPGCERHAAASVVKKRWLIKVTRGLSEASTSDQGLRVGSLKFACGGLTSLEYSFMALTSIFRVTLMLIDEVVIRRSLDKEHLGVVDEADFARAVFAADLIGESTGHLDRPKNLAYPVIPRKPLHPRATEERILRLTPPKRIDEVVASLA